MQIVPMGSIGPHNIYMFFFFFHFISPFMSFSFIWYFLIPFVAKSFRDVTLRDWEVYWPPRTDVPRWSLSSDTVKFYIDILYLFSECSFHLFLYWSSSDTLLSSDWVLGPALSNAICTYRINWPPQLWLFFKWKY